MANTSVAINGRRNTLAMPLVKNVAEGLKGWKKVKCQFCQSECWERPEQESLVEQFGLEKACTECALKTALTVEK